jgi:Ca2+-transporting ATPase
MVVILIAACAISALLEEFVDAIIILVIVILNSAFGFFQEYKADRALLALQRLSAPRAAVVRDGKEVSVPAREVVPGDIVVLRTGDVVPADCRLIESHNLRIDEAALTGESQSSSKNFRFIGKEGDFVGDMENMAFSSTTVEYGRGLAVAVRTGMGTEVGQIAELIRKEEYEMTHLQTKLDRMGKQIGIAVLAICIAVFVSEVVRFGDDNIFEVFMVSVSLAVAAIPEGLPAVVTISLALGLQAMVRKNALIRRLPAVETLGSTTVICSDKTGTLTMGVMNIKEIATLDRTYRVGGEGYRPSGEFFAGEKSIDPRAEPGLELLLTAGMLCNDSKLVMENGEWTAQGDSTEAAFVVAAGRAGLNREELGREYPRIAENPFDSEKKFMTTIHEHKGKRIAFTKGAVDRMLPLCSRKMENGMAQPISEQDVRRIGEMHDWLASGAYRVLAVAYRESDGPMDQGNAEDGLVFLGLVGMIDAPRKEAAAAVRECQRAGIRVVMITGDHKLTAVAIARQMGIAQADSLAYTGAELNAMSDDQLVKEVERVAVYARVSPEHKMRIIDAWKKRGQIVAMTGDGVNDAPALKKADIGVAMGITGTDVSKEAADMVLTDDNFASIVHAIEVGRGIYDNIKKFVKYMLSTNLGEVLIIFSAALIGMPLPLIAIQLLWINLITDGLPALSLGIEPAEEGVMDRPPRNPGESIFSGGMAYHIAWVGTLMTIGTLGVFAWALEGDWSIAGNPNLVRAQSMAFLTLALFQLWHVLAIHVDKETVISRKFFANPYLILAVLVSAGLQLAVIYLPPLAGMFRVEALPLREFVLCALVASSVFFAVEAEKFMRRSAVPKRENGAASE